MPLVTLPTPLYPRWVLFEEKLEGGASRWSAPHVPTLALPSLWKLRSLLAEGLVLLDCPAQNLLELVGKLGAFAGKVWLTIVCHPESHLSESPITHLPQWLSTLVMGWKWKSRVKHSWSLHSLKLPEGKGVGMG